MPETKVRTYRCDNALYEAAQAKARRQRETVAAVLKRALVEYVGDELEDDMAKPMATGPPKPPTE